MSAIADTFASGQSPREILRQVLDLLERRLELVRGTVMLLLPDNTHLVVEAAHSPEQPIREHVSYHRGEGIIGRVVETGTPVIVPDIQNEPAFKNRIHRRVGTAKRKTGFVCVPVVLSSEVVGTLSADIPHGARLSLEQGQRAATIVAAMAANFLRTERLVRQERQTWEHENARLRNELGEQFRPDAMIGTSHAMREVFSRIKLLADNDTTVLIRGPSGTGKEMVASAVHYAGRRREAPMIKVNCAALSESLIESELFGHERGAFSGALYTRKGRIEEAEGGTLFLDEIGDFSPQTQVKLLRVIQEREYQRVGSNESRRANIRLVAATNRDLEDDVAQGVFREDLYYRINVFPIFLPALHQRKDDILPLANHFVEKYAQRIGKSIRRISTPAINMMMAYHWPGNVRELENCIEYAVLLANDGVIYAHNLPPTLQVPDHTGVTASGGLRGRVQALERDMISDALKRTNGNVAAAARELEITARMVRYKISQFGMDPHNID